MAWRGRRRSYYGRGSYESDYGYRPYVSVGQRASEAAKASAKLAKKGEKLEPVSIEGRKIARTFWGQAWCEHLESYSDYANRLPRGRSYLSNGLVIDLKVGRGQVRALVSGTDLYRITIDIHPLQAQRWAAIRTGCTGRIDTVVELLQGRLADDVMRVICDRKEGLFPSPGEITMKCSCPDWATMCKHVAASLYGIGARLDREPQLLFTLRGVDHLDLVSQAAGAGLAAAPAGGDALAESDLGALFGIELESRTSADRPAGGNRKGNPPRPSAVALPAAAGKRVAADVPGPQPPEGATRTRRGVEPAGSAGARPARAAAEGTGAGGTARARSRSGGATEVRPVRRGTAGRVPVDTAKRDTSLSKPIGGVPAIATVTGRAATRRRTASRRPPAAWFRPGRKVTPADLLALGIPRSTFQNWLTAGVLEQTGLRGIYEATRATDDRIRLFLQKTVE